MNESNIELAELTLYYGSHLDISDLCDESDSDISDLDDDSVAME